MFKKISKKRFDELYKLGQAVIVDTVYICNKCFYEVSVNGKLVYLQKTKNISLPQ